MLSGYVALHQKWRGEVRRPLRGDHHRLKHYANGLMMPRKQRNRQIASRWDHLLLRLPDGRSATEPTILHHQAGG